MWIFVWRLKIFIRTLLALVFSAVVLCCSCVTNICRFSAVDGERIFYLHSASSQGLRAERLTFLDIPHIRGESVRFDIATVFGDGEIDEIAARIAKEYEATILFTEEASGVKCYYGYTPQWSGGMCIAGRNINLHVVLRTDKTVGVVGSPIIFDGF
jgi:hypothetical protein